ncbi:MAG: prephenate dehydrogenase [archaeon]|nr:prephenate dehydrogenase [archaeon]
MTLHTFGFVGLGLIGGSIARALKAYDANNRIVAYDANRKALTQAYEDGVVDVLVSEIDSRFSDCDFIFLCAPVKFNMDNAAVLKPLLKEGAVLTDVGSVKGEMHQRIHELGLDGQFIGGHPMAGSERVGYANSKAKLLENAYYIITRTESSTKEQTDAYCDIVRMMGAIPLVMTPQQHDYITAAVSHVPHVISASLVNLVRDSDSPNEEMKMIAAGGFKDITRISSSSPVMWQQICLTNSQNVSDLLEDYIRSLTDMKAAIDSHDADKLMQFFDGARKYRDTFIDASRGPIKTANTVHVEIYDEPGALAIVATILASRSINVKNVGIIHNREFETGSLRIDLHDEKEVIKAKEVLEFHGYEVTIG